MAEFADTFRPTPISVLHRFIPTLASYASTKLNRMPQKFFLQHLINRNLQVRGNEDIPLTRQTRMDLPLTVRTNLPLHIHHPIWLASGQPAIGS
jgi:hypothetical protein